MPAAATGTATSAAHTSGERRRRGASGIDGDRERAGVRVIRVASSGSWISIFGMLADERTTIERGGGVFWIWISPVWITSSAAGFTARRGFDGRADAGTTSISTSLSPGLPGREDERLDIAGPI